MALTDNEMMAAIAVTRFGLGGRPGELEAARGDPKGFLKAQIRPEGADQPAGDLPDSAERLADMREYRQAKRMARRAPQEMQKSAVQALRKEASAVRDEFDARLSLAIGTQAAFRERWTAFWSNHFTVSAVKLASANQAGVFEREAIRPHVFGRFEDMLVAASSHPGMLLYLDQAQSIGPNSPAGQRREGQRGLNENLAREIMELHTVGLGAGYSQADVTEFARAMTGWTIGGEADPPESRDRFVFRPRLHEPGVRTILGKAYAQRGQAQARAVMADLAAHPATARHLAEKLARHFVADDPPPALVGRLEQAYSGSGGRLDKVAEALIDAPEAWTSQAAKFKTPYDYVVSSWRAVGTAPRNRQQPLNALAQLGQKPFAAPSPKGWPEEAQAWAAPDAVLKRLAFAETLSAQAAADVDPMTVAKTALGARLSKPVMVAVASAESRQEAMTVLLMSPEFQRR